MLLGTKDFNPRSREGSDDKHVKDKHMTGISIHAPAKGATAPAKTSTSNRAYFNPRSREGSDDIDHIDLMDQDNISIHAPAKGATSRDLLNGSLTFYFNPRSREGSDTMWNC